MPDVRILLPDTEKVSLKFKHEEHQLEVQVPRDWLEKLFVLVLPTFHGTLLIKPGR